jgi:hypothetical protein
MAAMRRARRGAAAALAAVVAVGGCTAMAQELPFPPRQSEICIAYGGRKVVDKKKLARYLLTKFPFNAAAVPERDDPGFAGLDLNRRIIADPQICHGNAFCKKGEQESVAGIRGNMAALLLGTIPGYRPTVTMDPEAYILGANEDGAIVCEQEGGRPVEAPGAVLAKPPKATSPVRVRGKAGDLYIDRDQGKDFQGTSQAIASYAVDDIAGKSTATVKGAFGYAIQTELLKEKGQRFDLVPYVETNTVFVEAQPGSKSKANATQTVNTGVLASLFLVSSSDFGHVLNFRPDFLFDFEDDSQLLTARLQYIPVVRGLLNDFIRFVPDRDDFASFKPVLELRADTGVYTEKGSNPIAMEEQRLVRLGGMAGVAIVSDSDLVPLSFNASYTWLEGVLGRDIGYFSGALTWHLDPKKYFGITATYSKGERDDTARREDQWMIGLSGRF